MPRLRSLLCTAARDSEVQLAGGDAPNCTQVLCRHCNKLEVSLRAAVLGYGSTSSLDRTLMILVANVEEMHIRDVMLDIIRHELGEPAVGYAAAGISQPKQEVPIEVECA
jgi:hypothetical protein